LTTFNARITGIFHFFRASATTSSVLQAEKLKIYVILTLTFGQKVPFFGVNLTIFTVRMNGKPGFIDFLGDFRVFCVFLSKKDLFLTTFNARITGIFHFFRASATTSSVLQAEKLKIYIILILTFGQISIFL